MQQKSPSKGTFIALILIVVVSLGLFFYYRGTPTDSSISSLVTTSTTESIAAQASANRVLILLNTISSLKIDGSIFKTPTYNSLVDYTITIPELPVGRPNPFSPVAGTVDTSTSIKLPKTGR